ncbi:MAG: DnaJ domain-containing protein, partial [Nitrospiraceae bacterium]|nr:DnaJ domain-containing protein [Nitrospiraceae bacterium]
ESGAAEDANQIGPEISRGQVARINDMHRLAARHNHYETLGLYSRMAGPAEIKKAYYRAAMEFHPDRNFYLPAELTGKLNEIFAAIATAYATLSDPVKRMNYDASLRQGTSVKLAPAPKSAVENFNHGKAYYLNRDFKKAELFFAIAMGLDARKPEYLLYYGSTLRRLGKDKEAIKILHRALSLNRESTAILAEVGLVYLKLGLPDRAEHYLKQALRKDPSNRKVINALLKIKSGRT